MSACSPDESVAKNREERPDGLGPPTLPQIAPQLRETISHADWLAQRGLNNDCGDPFHDIPQAPRQGPDSSGESRAGGEIPTDKG
jgi:hypothetical protein